MILVDWIHSEMLKLVKKTCFGSENLYKLDKSVAVLKRRKGHLCKKYVLFLFFLYKGKLGFTPKIKCRDFDKNMLFNGPVLEECSFVYVCISLTPHLKTIITISCPQQKFNESLSRSFHQLRRMMQ